MDEATPDVIIPTNRTVGEVAPLVEELVRTAGLLIRVHATCRDLSAAANRNLGLDQARSDIIFFSDDDIRGLPHGWALRMLHVMETRPKCVMCAPRLMRLGGIFSDQLGNPRDMMYHPGNLEIIPSRKLPTAFCAVRNDGTRYGENDTDYCRRLLERHPGAEFILCHDLRVTQTEPMTWMTQGRSATVR